MIYWKPMFLSPNWFRNLFGSYEPDFSSWKRGHSLKLKTIGFDGHHKYICAYVIEATEEHLQLCLSYTILDGLNSVNIEVPYEHGIIELNLALEDFLFLKKGVIPFAYVTNLENTFRKYPLEFREDKWVMPASEKI